MRSALLGATRPGPGGGERSDVFDAIAKVFSGYAAGPGGGSDSVRAHSDSNVSDETTGTALRAEGSVATGLRQGDPRSSDAGVASLRAALDQLQHEYDRVARERDGLLQRAVQAEAVTQTSSAQSSTAVHVLQGKLSTLEGAAHVAEANKRQLVEHVTALQQALAAHQQHAFELNETLQAERAEMSEVRVVAGRVGALATHVSHLQHDNARLLSLLHSTGEYAAFVRRGFPRVGGGYDDDGAASDGAPFHRSVYLGGLPVPGQEAAARFLGGAHSRDALPRGLTPHATEPDWTEPDTLPGEARWDEVPRLDAEYGAAALAVNEEGDAVRADRAGQAQYVHPSLVPFSANVYAADVVDDYSGGRLERGSAVDAMLEVQHWVPADAAALSSRFRRKFLQSVPPEHVAAFLLGLNVAWLTRMDEVLAESTKKLKAQVKELRVALQRREPFREVMQASTIARLHVEVSALRQAVGKTSGRPSAAITTTTDRSPSPVAFGKTIPARDGTGRTLASSFRAPRKPSRSPSPPPATHDELHAAVRMVTGEGGARQSQDGALAASLLSVPGSGARRYDGVQSAALLQSALQAVDVLTGKWERAQADVTKLKEVLTREGLSEADIVAVLAPAAGGKDAEDAREGGKGRPGGHRTQERGRRMSVTDAVKAALGTAYVTSVRGVASPGKV